MKTMWMMLFLLLPLAALVYLSWHIWVMLPVAGWLKFLVIAIGVVSFALLFLTFRRAFDGLPLWVARMGYEVGTSSLIVLLYLVMLFLVLDLGRLVRLVPKAYLYHNGYMSVGILVFMLGLFVYANLHYQHKERVALDLKTAKPLAKDYKIVMASDLHIGYHNPRKELARWVDMMNAEQPDLILIAGDIIDGSMRPVMEERMAEEFRRLNAPVYACLGNHEFYAGVPEARQFYRDAGIHLLIDESTVIDSSLVIIGRDDRTNMHRKSLGRIVKENELLISHSSFLILLDHQPYHLEQAERHHVDFQFSGHTHHGQVWPISWITESIYECAFGSYQRGNTRYYISSGLGIWGGKFRIGTRSEYIVAEVR